MKLRGVGFQAAVDELKAFNGVKMATGPAESRETAPLRPTPPQSVESASKATENPPFKGTYDKFAVDCTWLKERVFTPETLQRFDAFEYDNPKRRRRTAGP